MEEIAKYLKAIVALQVHQLNQSGTDIKLEPVLSLAGLSHREIAGLLGKSEAAVAKAVSRARLAAKETGKEKKNDE